MKKFLFWAVAVMLMVLGTQPSKAAEKPSLVKTTSLAVGKTKKVSIKAKKIKKTSWSVGNKKIATLSKKKKGSVTIKGKKKGSTVLTAKTKVGKKTYKNTCKIVVVKNANISLPEKNVKAFSGRVWTTLTVEGYVRIKWDKVANAHSYSVQRMELSGSWKNLKVTAKQFVTDSTVKEFSSYAYRVRANCSDASTSYSSPVIVVTGKITKAVPEEVNTSVTPEPQLTPEPTAEPTPEPTPYQAKYSYEVEVLNKFTIYENVPIVLYIKTDKPSSPSFASEDLSEYSYKYEDIYYSDKDEQKVDDGYICTIQFSSPGTKTVAIEEFDETDKSGGRYGTYKKVAEFQIVVQDGEKSLQSRCKEIIKEVSSDSYNEDGRGKWSDLCPQDKLERLESYVRNHFHYPRIGALTVFGYKTVWYIQENVGAYWETGFADCGASNDMMCVLARTLGYEAELRNTTLDGLLHVQAAVTINGTEYIYDATPYQGGYQDWDYIL